MDANSDWFLTPACREEELSSCQDQLGEFRSAASALTKWLEEANDKVPADQPSSSEKTLENDLQIVTVSHEINTKYILERVLFLYVFYLTAVKVLEQKSLLFTHWHSSLEFMGFAIGSHYVLVDYSPSLLKLQTTQMCLLCLLMTAK